MCQYLAHGLRYGSYDDAAIVRKFELQDKRFSEVVISRWLLEPPKFTLDSDHRMWTGKAKQVSDVLFDASNTESISQTLLLPMYRDLMETECGENLTSAEMLDEIIGSVEFLTECDVEQGSVDDTPILKCYLVSDDYLKLLQETHWFSRLKRELAGRLLFINWFPCYDSKNGACVENQRKLLDALKHLMIVGKRSFKGSIP